MLVKALCLRNLGRRLSAEELRAAKPLTGNLRVEPELTRGQLPNSARMALLLPVGKGVDPLVQLHGMRLLKIDDRGLLIAGIEERWERKKRIDYRQALWCWPVDARDLTGADPIDAEEEADQTVVFRDLDHRS
jgi:hypothetical protein